MILKAELTVATWCILCLQLTTKVEQNVSDHILEEMIKEQARAKAYYDNFPNITDIMHDYHAIREALTLTASILNELPSGNSNEKNTLYHVIDALFGRPDAPVLFFDSNKGMRLYDASRYLADIASSGRPFVLLLRNLTGLGDYRYEKNTYEDVLLIQKLNDAINQNKSHPIIDDIIERLSKAYRPEMTVIINRLYYGSSITVVYTVEDFTIHSGFHFGEILASIKNQFKQFEAAKIHPLLYQSLFDKLHFEASEDLRRLYRSSFHKLYYGSEKIHQLLYRPSFDIANFDARGNKAFGTGPETFEVGPPNNRKTYTTPTGWVRYGLKVLGKYENDDWLHPFQHPGNWYRAFHGTKNAASCDFQDSSQSFDQSFASIDAMASIYHNGFKLARVKYYGEGVYSSPNPRFVEKQYAGTVSLNTKKGLKKYTCMLQVAVNPNDVNCAKGDIWVVSLPENIRPYGILIKEVD